MRWRASKTLLLNTNLIFFFGLFFFFCLGSSYFFLLFPALCPSRKTKKCFLSWLWHTILMLLHRGKTLASLCLSVSWQKMRWSWIMICYKCIAPQSIKARCLKLSNTCADWYSQTCIITPVLQCRDSSKISIRKKKRKNQNQMMKEMIWFVFLNENFYFKMYSYVLFLGFWFIWLN